MNHDDLEPLWDYVLVRQLKEEDAAQTKSAGIGPDGKEVHLFLPLVAQRREVDSLATVVAIGPKCVSGIAVGDRIVMPQFAGQDIGQRDTVLVSERELKARVKNLEPPKDVNGNRDNWCASCSGTGHVTVPAAGAHRMDIVRCPACCP